LRMGDGELWHTGTRPRTAASDERDVR
jgi:hypothetical protein